MKAVSIGVLNPKARPAGTGLPGVGIVKYKTPSHEFKLVAEIDYRTVKVQITLGIADYLQAMGTEQMVRLQRLVGQVKAVCKAPASAALDTHAQRRLPRHALLLEDLLELSCRQFGKCYGHVF